MSIGQSSEVIIWIIALGTLSLIIIIWGLYKLLSFFRNRRDATIAYPESPDSSASQYQNTDINYKSMRDVEANESNSATKSITLSEAAGFPRTQIIHQGSKSRYIDYKPDGKSNDRILRDAFKSSSIKRNPKMQEIRSYGSRKSTGFEITIKSVEPAKKGSKSNSFLTILDRLNAMDEDDVLERERKKRRKEEEIRRNAAYTASSSGIEADSSDETASQTFIGQDPEATPDPGQIQLGLIKAQDPDLTSDA